MTNELYDYNVQLALTFFEFVMVCVGLFYSILESSRQKKWEYSSLTWGLSAYFVSLIIDILSNPNIGAIPILTDPFWVVMSSALSTGAIISLANTLVTHSLTEKRQFVLVIGILSILLAVSFMIFALYPDGIVAGQWIFAFQQVFILIYAFVILVSQPQERSLYSQGFFLFLAFGRISFLAYLAGRGSVLPQIFQGIVEPLGFLFLVMAINQLIAKDLQRLNLQLMRRTELLEEATRSLTKLNQLSTNLLKTTHIPGIVETVLGGLAEGFGLTHTFLLLLDRETRILRGMRLDSNNHVVHFMDIDMRHSHFLKDAMLKGKSRFFGEGSRMPDRDFLKNYNFSKNLVTVPLLTKKEKTCYEVHECEKVSCKVMQHGSSCWTFKDECQFYTKEQAKDFLDCVDCKAFNIVGLLVVDNRNPKYRVDEKNLAFLKTFSNQAGMALHNAMLVEELAREVSFRERTLRNLPNGVMVLDERGLIQSLNPSLLDILDMKNKDVTGIPYEAVRLVNDEEHFQKIVNSALDEGKSYEGIGESWTLTLPGRTLKLNIKVNPLPGSGRRYGAVILFEDITDVTALQEQLVQSEKLATLGQMAAGIAHEVNNPLAGVSGFLQVMASRLPEDSPERLAMQAALSNINRASGTIKDLLKLARLGPAQKRAVQLKEVIRESLVFVQFQKEHKGVSIIENFNADLPDVVIDPDQMRQVFTNLVLNALQAMGETGTLTVSTAAANGMLRTFIEDTGMGIPAENFELIFEPWFTTKQAKGTGLGLMNSEKIIKDHGGYLAFSSVEGKGSTFIVDLPMKTTE